MAELDARTTVADDLKNAGVKTPVDDGSEIDENEEVQTGDGADEGDDTGGATEADLKFARDNGWAPIAQWHGDPAKYENAKDFADRARGINALLQKRLQQRDQEFNQLREDVRTLTEGTRKTQVRDIDAKILDARARRVLAVENGDGKGMDEAEREIASLSQQRAEVAGATTPKGAPEESGAPTLNESDKRAVQEWQARNTWLDDNPKLARLAAPISAEIRQQRPDLIGNVAGFLSEVERRIKEDYPEYFPAPMSRSRTESGGAPPRDQRRMMKKSYENLPSEAKAACDRLLKKGYIRSKEDYVKNYDWEG